VKMRWLEKAALNSAVRGWLLRRYEAPRVFKDLSPIPGRTVLEIGTGNGLGAMLISKHLAPATIVAIDLDPAMLKAARAKLSNPPAWAEGLPLGSIRLIEADASRLPFENETFDAAFLFGALHHIEPWRRVIAETYRTLKPGGVFAFEEALIGESPLAMNRYWRHVPFGLQELREALTGAGFLVERLKVSGRGYWVFGRLRKPE